VNNNTKQILVVDDIPAAYHFFKDLLKDRHDTTVTSLSGIDSYFEINSANFSSLSERFSSLISSLSNGTTLLFVNAHLGKLLRARFEGIDLVWSLRGCSLANEAIGNQLPAALTLAVIIYSPLNKKQLTAYSLARFGQSIFDIPYNHPRSLYVNVAQSRETIRSVMTVGMQSLLSAEPDEVNVGLDTYHTRLKILTEQFVSSFRHDIRGSLQQNDFGRLKQAPQRIENLNNQIEAKVSGIDLSNSHLADVIRKIRQLLEPMMQGVQVKPSSPLSIDTREKIVHLQESVAFYSNLYSLYATRVKSFLDPNIFRKTGVVIIEDEAETASEYRAEMIKRMGLREQQIVILTHGEEFQADTMIEEIKKRQNQSLRIEVVIVDLVLGLDEEAGIEIIRRLRFEFPRIRIVVISGRNDRQFEALAHGADYYVTKPIENYERDFCSILGEALYWKKVLMLETEPAHQANLQLVAAFRCSHDEPKTPEQKYREITQNVRDYFSAQWIKFEHRIIEDNIPSQLISAIEDGHYDLILLDSFANDSGESDSCTRLFKDIRRQHGEIPVIILSPSGIGELKNKLVFRELKKHFRIDFDDFWVKPLSFERLRQIKGIFEQQMQIKYDARYTLLLPDKNQPQDEKPITDEEKIENMEIKRQYFERICRAFGGATIWEGLGYWWDSLKFHKDSQSIVYVLTRYAPGNRSKLLKFMEDYKRDTNQDAIFLQEEKVNTYERRP